MDDLLKTTNGSAKIVADFLRNYSEKNNWNRIETTKKGIDECWKYITDQARKQASNGCAAIPDTEVFNWAIEFYEDYQEGKKDAVKGKVEIDTTIYDEVKRNAEKRESAKKGKKKSTEEQYEEQMFSLFDL